MGMMKWFRHGRAYEIAVQPNLELRAPFLIENQWIATNARGKRFG